MSAVILDGKALAQEMRVFLKEEVDLIKQKTGKTPCFKNIVVGEDPSSGSYGKSQIRVAMEVGIDYQFVQLPEDISQTELIDQIILLNGDAGVHGIMLHKPLPEVLDFQEATNYIALAKDIEGMNDVNLGRLMLGRTDIVPCTAAAVMVLLEKTGVDLKGKEAVVVGRSEIVGKPLSLLLLEKSATVTICHSQTTKAGKLEEHLRRADIVVGAVGIANFIKGDMLKEDVIVIDVGINYEDGKLVGDVEFESAQKKASYITPVPGGVGPVTAVCLMRNGIAAFKGQIGRSC